MFNLLQHTYTQLSKTQMLSTPAVTDRERSHTYSEFFSCLTQGFGPSVAAIPPQRRGDSEIVFGAVTASDLRPEPRNVHRFDAADKTEKQLWRLNYL